MKKFIKTFLLTISYLLLQKNVFALKLQKKLLPTVDHNTTNPQPNLLCSKIGNCKITLVQGDITIQFQGDSQQIKQQAAIVNAAKPSLLGGGGIDGAIHTAAGSNLFNECKNIKQHPNGNRCNIGEAVITGGHNLAPVKIIHTVGPHGTNYNKSTLLNNAYQNSLQCAKNNGIKYIAFPSISTGIYGYDIKAATLIAFKSAIDFVQKNKTCFTEIRFVSWDQHAFQIYQQVFNQKYNLQLQKS